MKRALFIIAFIIFANPIISNVDFLPDFLGCILIMIALSKPSYYSEKAQVAYRCAKNMLIISALRTASIFLTVTFADSMMPLLFSFTFGVIELVFGIPLIFKLFDYFGELAIKTENGAAIKVLDGFKIATVALTSVRLLLSTLPDFILLTAGDPLSTYHVDYSYIRPALIVIALLISLFITGAYLSLNIPLCFILFNKREKALSSELFVSRVPHKSFKYSYRAHQIFFTLLCVLALCVYEVKIDGKTLTQSSWLLVVFTLGYLIFLICRFIKLDYMFFAYLGASVTHLVFDAVAGAITKSFYRDYTLESVLKVSRAETMYFSVIPFSLLGAVFFSVAVAIMLHLIVTNGKKALANYAPSLLSGADIEFTLKDYVRRIKPLGITACSLSLVNALFSQVVYVYMPQIDEVTVIKIFGAEFKLWILPSLLPIKFIILTAFIVTFIVTVIRTNDLSFKKVHTAVSLD